MNDRFTARIAYPGLRPFEREEFDLFFGREDCVDEMVDTLAANRFLAVLGTSGSGKSSLVRTGLLNALELGFLASAGSNWQIADLRPRGHPIRSLAVALLGLQGIAEPEEGEIEVLSSFLRRGPRSLVEWFHSGHLEDGANLLVLVDQFEELFRYEDYSGREEAEAFVALLIEAAGEPDLPLYVVITMRSEYLGACTLIESLPEVINRGLYLTPRMTRGECREAIDGPAGVCGFTIEEALTNRLLNDLTDFAPWEAGGGHDQRRRLGRRADQLPLMQHVLNLLWQRALSRDDEDIVLTLADYEAAGHLGGALDRHADEIAASIDPAHADVIDTVFRGLVTGRTVTEAGRRPTRFGELVELAGGRRESVAAVIDAFRASGVNFLTPPPTEALTDDTIIDISHESLIRQWQRLSHCLDEEAQSADAWDQLLSRAERFAGGTGGLLTDLDLDNLVAWWDRTQPTQAWANRYGDNFEEARKFLDDSQAAETARKQREDEDQRKLIEAEEAARTGTRFKRLSGALAAAVVLAVVGAGAALFLWREANQQATFATEQARIAGVEREEAERQRLLANQEREEALRQEMLAEQERQRAEEQAEIADLERERAEQQADLAEQAREKALVAAEEARQSAVAAKRAQEAAEVAREEAIAAKEEAASANARLVAQQLGTRVNAIHNAIGDNPTEIAKAGSLLSHAAEAAYVENPAAATVENLTTVELLRPALALQTSLSTATIPEPVVPEQDFTQWKNPAGGPGLTAVINWSFQDGADEFFRIFDPLGRVVARYALPQATTNFEITPIGAALIGPDIPMAVMATGDGEIWGAVGEHGRFVRYRDTTNGGAERFDDIRYDPVSERLYVVYVARGGEERTQRLLVLERDSDDWSDWKVVGDHQLGQPVPVVVEVRPTRIAGTVDDLLYAVVGEQLVAIDADGVATRVDVPGRVIDATMMVDGAYLLAGTAVNGCGVAGALPDTVLDRPNCLVLIDRATGEAVWHGEAQQRMRLQTAHSIGGVDPSFEFIVEVYPGDASRRPPRSDAPWVLNDMWVRKLFRADDGAWADSLERFDPEKWGGDAFGAPYAIAAATGATYPTALDKDYITQLFGARILPRVAGELADSNAVLTWHLDGDDFRAVGVRRDGPDESLEIDVYRPERETFVSDQSFISGPVLCPASADRSLGGCTFLSGAFAPDGETLVLTTNYGEHAFIKRGEPFEWRRNVPAAGGDFKQDSLTQLSPLDVRGNAFLVRGPTGNLWRLTDRQVVMPETEDQEESAPRGTLDQVIFGDKFRQIIADMDGFTTDPSSGAVLIWGDSGLSIVALEGEDGLEAVQQDFIANNAITDVASLGDGRFVVATTDARLSLYEIDGGLAVERDRVETGLSGFGAIELSVANDEVIANAGDENNYRLRSNAFGVVDDRLENRFATPWDNFAGQLANGEVASVAFGAEIFGAPDPLPEGADLLGLTVMREQRLADDGSGDFRHVFQSLRRRQDGTVKQMETPCGTAVAVAARVTEVDRLEGAFDTVARVCRRSPDGQPFADAVGLAGRDRILALLRLVGSSPYAFEMLMAILRATAPDAAAVFADYEPESGALPTASLVSEIAGGAPIPDALAEADTRGASSLDPYEHWRLAVVAENRGPDPEPLAEALFHFAKAEQQFRAVGQPVPPQVSTRRATLARVLDDAVVIEVAKQVLEEQSSAGGIVGPESVETSVSALTALAAWIDEAASNTPDQDLLIASAAIVEEALGDALASTDPEEATAHYREAMRLISFTEATLSPRGAIAGRIDEIEAIRDKMLSIGAGDANIEAATVIIGIVDSEFEAPVTRDGELRRAIREAFETLAEGDAQTIDLNRLQHARFAFLDYDWEDRSQSIIQTSALAFLNELEAAEAFFSTAIERADEGDRGRWQAMRGRIRFWLSTLADDSTAREPEAFDDWLAGSIADFEAVGDVSALSLWDTVVLGSAYSRMIERTADPADVASLLARAEEAFEQALGETALDDLPDYRQRLVFDGYVVALERALLRVRRDPFLAGFGPQPGDADYDRDELADVVFNALSLARQREDVRSRAIRRFDDLESEGGWSLGTRGDYYWGFTAAQAGALLRIESGANGLATTCDQLAVHPYDVERSTPPVSFSQIEIEPALAACRGDTAREKYNLARVMSKGGEPAAAIVELLIDAARAGSPIAYNNLVIIIGSPFPDFVSAADLLTTFSSLSLIKAYPELSELLRSRLGEDEQRRTFEWLATKAADLGVPEAHRDLAELAAEDPLISGYHLAVAEALFADAGRNDEADAAGAALAALPLSSDDIDWIRREVGSWLPVSLVRIDDAMAEQIRSLW